MTPAPTGLVPAPERQITPRWPREAIGGAFGGNLDAPLRPERIGEGYGLSGTLHRVAWQARPRPSCTPTSTWTRGLRDLARSSSGSQQATP